MRAEFPALQRWTYLNSATYGQMPRCAVDAITRHSEQRDELACTNFLDWYTETDRMRASIARLIHADADDIAFVPNAAAALSIVVSGLAPGPDDNIVTLLRVVRDRIHRAARHLAVGGGIEIRPALERRKFAANLSPVFSHCRQSLWYRHIETSPIQALGIMPYS